MVEEMNEATKLTSELEVSDDTIVSEERFYC